MTQSEFEVFTQITSNWNQEQKESLKKIIETPGNTEQILNKKDPGELQIYIWALNIYMKSIDCEIERLKKQAEKIGISEEANNIIKMFKKLVKAGKFKAQQGKRFLKLSNKETRYFIEKARGAKEEELKAVIDDIYNFAYMRGYKAAGKAEQ